MAKPSKSQWDFGERFRTKQACKARRTPTGCRPPAQSWRSAAQPTLGLAREVSVPCRGTGTCRACTRFRRPFRVGQLCGAGSQGSAARNPGLYSVAPLGQGAFAPLISTRLQPGVSVGRWGEPFQRFALGLVRVADAEAVETAPARDRLNTGLKPGANERFAKPLPAFFFAPSAPYCG